MHKNQSKRLAKYSKRTKPPNPVKSPPLIYNSWWATLLLPALLAVIGGLLAWLIFSNAKALWLTNTLPLIFVIFVAIFPASDIRLGKHSPPPQGSNHARRRQARIRLSEHSNPHQGHTTYKSYTASPYTASRKMSAQACEKHCCNCPYSRKNCFLLMPCS